MKQVEVDKSIRSKGIRTNLSKNVVMIQFWCSNFYIDAWKQEAHTCTVNPKKKMSKYMKTRSLDLVVCFVSANIIVNIILELRLQIRQKQWPEHENLVTSNTSCRIRMSNLLQNTCHL